MADGSDGAALKQRYSLSSFAADAQIFLQLSVSSPAEFIVNGKLCHLLCAQVKIQIFRRILNLQKNASFIPHTLLKVKSAKTGVMLRRIKPLNMYPYQCGRFFFGLLNNILVFTETFAAAPCHIMRYKNICHLRVIYIQNVAISLYTAGFSVSQ